jgi:hypothetical protein
MEPTLKVAGSSARRLVTNAAARRMKQGTLADTFMVNKWLIVGEQD